MTFRRIFTVFLVTLIALTSCLPVTAYAEGSFFCQNIITEETPLLNEKVEFAEDDASCAVMQEEYYDEYGALHTRYINENGTEVTPQEHHALLQKGFILSQALPSYYDSRELNRVTSVKNQGSTSTCWAHSFCAAAESSLISQGYETDSIDLSEAHLAWFSFNTYDSSSGNPADLDSINVSNPFSSWGSAFLSAGTVARGSGLTTEARFPFSTSTSKMEFDSKYKYESEYQIESVEQYSSSDRDAIKNAIMRSGAITVSYYNNSSYYKSSSDGYCYYQNVNSGTNHLVAIVGWNDSFPASSFKVKPNGNGAWLCKNSWGTNWGDNGYFWISYYDISLIGFDEVIVKPSENYERIYQYDGIVTTGYRYYSNRDTAYMANIFTAKSSEIVSKAYFKSEGDNVCEVSLYKNLTDLNNPCSGTLIETKNVDCPVSGYYSAEFDNFNQINANEVFSVVIKITGNNTSEAHIPCEYSTNSSYVYRASTGQSFISNTGNSWYDLSAGNEENVPIKVYTKPSDYMFVTSFDIVSYPDKRTYIIGEQFDPTGMVVRQTIPHDGVHNITSGLRFLHFYSAAEGKFPVTVYYKGKTEKFDINFIKAEPESIRILSLPDKLVYIKGEKFDPAGMVVRVSFADSTFTDLTAPFDISGFDSSVFGKQTVTVNVCGKTTSFDTEIVCPEHSYTQTGSTPASWTHSGMKEYTCVNCGKTYQEVTHKSGQCGENTFWSFDEETATLYFSGTGIVNEYDAGENPFVWNPYIKSIYIDEEISDIPDGLFASCVSLQDIKVNSNNRFYCDIEGVLYNKDVTEIVKYPAGKPWKSFSIPSSVRIIGAGTFAFSSLEYVKIPSNVMLIEYGAFMYCSELQSISLPENLTEIGEGAFSLCTGLTEINIPENVNKIGEAAFTYCNNLERINVDENNGNFVTDSNGILYSKDMSELIYCPIANGITAFTVPDSVKTVNEYAFEENKTLQSVTLNSEMKKIPRRAFIDCENLNTVIMGRNITEIDEEAFQGCSGISTLYYIGTEAEWNRTDIDFDNDGIVKAPNKVFMPGGFSTELKVDGGLISGFDLTTLPSDISELIEVSDGKVTFKTAEDYCFCTGDKIKITYDIGFTEQYTVVIFGDVNNDGIYDGTDAIIVNCLANGLLSREQVGEAVFMAADCNHDGVIDRFDVDILNQAGVLLADVDQSKTQEELLETSSAYVEYLNLIDQTVETEVVEEEPVDPGYTFNFFDMILNFIKEIITEIKQVTAFFK